MENVLNKIDYIAKREIWDCVALMSIDELKELSQRTPSNPFEEIAVKEAIELLAQNEDEYEDE